MKVLLLILALLVATASLAKIPHPKDSFKNSKRYGGSKNIDLRTDARQDTVEFLEGFFKGALKAEGAEVDDCLDDANHILDTVEKLVGEIEDILSDPEQVILDFIDLLAEIPRSVVECKNLPEELSKFESWIQDAEDPQVMQLRLFNAFLYYGEDIKTDAKGLIDDYKRGMYTSSGYYLGDELYIIFEEVQPFVDTKPFFASLLKRD